MRTRLSGLVNPFVLVVGADELPHDVNLALLDGLTDRECGSHAVAEADRPYVVAFEFVQPERGMQRRGEALSFELGDEQVRAL